jgi:nucleoside-diphosphate-sugar epimerase
MWRILVTGGSGFIGTNVVEHYRVQGHDVLSIDIAEPRNPVHRPLWHELDITDAHRLEAAVRDFKPEYVFHFAARTDLDGDESSDYRVNTVGVANMLDSTARIPPKRIVFASTMLVCALGYKPRSDTDYCPPNAYGRSKVVAEEKIRGVSAGRVPWIIVRPTSIWGPWFGTPYKDFFDRVRKGHYLHPSRTPIRRTFGYVGNSVYQLDRLIRANEAATLGRTFYIGDYEATEIGAWADLIRKEFGSSRARRAPVALMKGLAAVGDVLKNVGFSNVPLTGTRLRNLLTEAEYDLAELRTICGDLPFDIATGVRLTAEWMRDLEQESSVTERREAPHRVQ